MKRTGSFIRQTFFYFINAVLSAALGILVNKIFALYLDPGDYGAYSVLFGIFSLFSSAIMAIFSNAILRYYKEYEHSNKLNELFSALIKMLMVTFLTFSILATVLVISIQNKIDPLYFQLIVLLILLFVPDGIKQIGAIFARCQGKAIRQLTASTTEHILKIVVFCACFFGLNIGVSSILWATLTATVSSALLYLDVWKISGNFLSIKTKQTSKKLLKFGLPLIGIPIINYLLSTSDQLIIKMFCGDYDAGLYAMGYKLSSAIFSLTTTFLITSSHHIIMDKYDNCDKCETESFLQNLALSYWTICLPLLICIFMFGKDIMMIMASEQYLDALMVFGLSSVGIVFGGYINYTNKAWELSNRSWIIALFSGSGALVNVILNIVLIPCYGYTVAAVTTIISYLTVIVFSYLLGRKIINPNPPICTTLKLLSCAASAFVVSALYVRLFPSGIIFSLLGCIIVVVVFAVVALLLLKKEFMKLFKQFSAQRG